MISQNEHIKKTVNQLSGSFMMPVLRRGKSVPPGCTGSLGRLSAAQDHLPNKTRNQKSDKRHRGNGNQIWDIPRNERSFHRASSLKFFLGALCYDWHNAA
jgi:hypothetical protein